MPSKPLRAGKAIKKQYKPLPHQAEFHRCPAKYRAMVSGMGGGKTVMGCWEVIKWTQLYPGGRFVVGRLTATALRDTTQKTFFDMLDPELIRHWQSTQGRLLVKTPIRDIYSEVLFRHLDEPGQLGSLDIDGFWIDEAHEPDGKEVPESTFLILQARLRGEVGPLRGIITTNSGGRDWVYHWFFSPNREDTENYKGFVAKTRDNPYLPKGYEEMLRANNPKAWVDRFLDASFDVFEGQIFMEFDERKHVIPHDEIDIPASWEKVGGFDFGVSAPTAIVLGYRDSASGMVVITDEYHQTEADISVVASWALSHGLNWLWADPSTRNRGVNKESPATAYAREGITLQPAFTNDDITKVSMVHQYLIKFKLRISDKCRHLIDSIKSQRWDSNRDGKRLKQNDHAFDALAYLLVSIPHEGGWLDVIDPSEAREGRGNGDFWQHPSHEEDLDNEERLWTEADYIGYL